LAGRSAARLLVADRAWLYPAQASWAVAIPAMTSPSAAMRRPWPWPSSRTGCMPGRSDPIM